MKGDKMEYYTNVAPTWLEQIAPEKFNDADLFKIVVFFVFHSPCPKQSARGKPLSEYNWNTPWKKPYRLDLQLMNASSLPISIKHFRPYKDAEKAFDEVKLKDNFPSDLSDERICIYDNEYNQWLSIFYHIRNSLAHGRLNMIDLAGECVFVLEDISTKKEKGKRDQRKVSARMILRKSTLLKWISIIEGGEQLYKTYPASKNKGMKAQAKRRKKQ